MNRRRILVAVALLGAAAAGTLVLALRSHGQAKAEPGQTKEFPEVAAELVLSPRILQFGDTLTAQVDVTVDRKRVDPDSVRIHREFLPWGLIEPPQRTRRDAGDTSLIQTSYVLRCLISPCVPPGETAQLEFDPVRITFRRLPRGQSASFETRWPVLVVHSNVVASDLERREAITSPWRADLLSMPPVSYAISPTLLRGLLVAGGALLALAGVIFAFLAVPKREPRPEPEPEPEPSPELSPLELALVLLTTDAQANGTADRRRALELVAEEMEEHDEVQLARRARAMAWSEETPTLRETSGLAASVRAYLAVVEPVPSGEENDAAET